jgi:hypothetical protein
VVKKPSAKPRRLRKIEDAFSEQFIQAYEWVEEGRPSSPERPPWDASPSAGDDAMLDWLNHHLDNLISDAIRQANASGLPSDEDVQRTYEMRAIEAAERENDFTKLSELLRLAEKSGQLSPLMIGWLADLSARKFRFKRSRGTPPEAVEVRRERSNAWLAAADVPRIRGLWKAHYGKVNRTLDLTDAVEFAARRWGLSRQQVANYMRRSASDRRRMD